MTLLVSPGIYVVHIDYSDVIDPPKTWKDVLRGLYLMNMMDRSENNLEYATRMMQERYPGPYIIEDYYNKELQSFDYRLKFEDSREHTMWLLKYS